MAKFKYRMQNILDIKNQMESQAKLEYAQARMVLNEEEEKLRKLHSRKNSYENEARRLLNDTLKVNKIIEIQQAIKRMDELIEEQVLSVRFAEKKMNEAEIKLTELMKERKTHENLREKALDEFVKEINASESKEIDQLTSYRFGKKITQQSDKPDEMDTKDE